MPKGNRKTAIITTAIIIILLLGYIPLSTYLFSKEFTIQYDIRIGYQYDTTEEEPTKPEFIDVITLDEKGSKLISGLHLEKRYTELILETQGVIPSSLEIEAEYTGDPEQLWMHEGGLYGMYAYSSPINISRLEEGEWEVLREGDMGLYQVDEEFQSLDEFYAFSAFTTEDIGLAGISPGELLALSLGQSESEVLELLDMPLRGPHALDLIVGDGDLYMEVTKQDLNRDFGGDDVTVIVKKDGVKIYENVLPDDGNISTDLQQTGGEQTAVIDLQDIDNGQYSVELRALFKADDFVITGIRSDAGKAVFKDRVFLFHPPETETIPDNPTIGSIDIFLDSPGGVLSAETWHPIFPRSVSLDGEHLLVFEAKGAGTPPQSGQVILEEGVKELAVENPGSLILEFVGGGFSFHPDVVFDPSFRHLRPVNDHPEQDFSMILTRYYQPPRESNGSMVFTRSISVEGQSLPGEKIRITMEKIGGEVVLTSLKIVLE